MSDTKWYAIICSRVPSHQKHVQDVITPVKRCWVCGSMATVIEQEPPKAPAPPADREQEWLNENRVRFLTGETVLVQYKRDEPFREVPYLDEAAMLRAYKAHVLQDAMERVEAHLRPWAKSFADYYPYQDWLDYSEKNVEREKRIAWCEDWLRELLKQMKEAK